MVHYCHHPCVALLFVPCREDQFWHGTADAVTAKCGISYHRRFQTCSCVCMLCVALAEKMGFGIAISMVMQMLLTVVGAGQAEAQKQRQQQLEMERMRRGYHRMHSARWVPYTGPRAGGGASCGTDGIAQR